MYEIRNYYVGSHLDRILYEYVTDDAKEGNICTSWVYKDPRVNERNAAEQSLPLRFVKKEEGQAILDEILAHVAAGVNYGTKPKWKMYKV